MRVKKKKKEEEEKGRRRKRRKKKKEEEEKMRRRRRRTDSMYRIHVFCYVSCTNKQTKHVDDMLHKGKYGQLHTICIKKKTFISPKMNLIEKNV